jgi:50S ribosomal protein L16 3-hydroxylase
MAMAARPPKLRRAETVHAEGDLLGMPHAEFLKRFWQKRPLLVRQALAGFESPITPDDLAALACSPLASARLVAWQPKSDRWRVRHGPFRPSDFKRLPPRHWTVLVQDCDKLAPAEIGPLLDPFRFIPDWRVDDVMVSYATDGGSVGAHLDRYDVFLVQGWGRRRWQISEDPRAPQALREDVDLKLLREFVPTREWVLEPGDLLYLPPGVPHHGIAEGDCMTFSVGLRAPSAGELMVDFAEYVSDRLGEQRRYADPELVPARRPAEIEPAVVRRTSRLLREAARLPPPLLRDWLARFLTRYRSAQSPVPPPVAIEPGALKRRVGAGTLVARNPWSRYAWYRRRGRAVAYFAGDRFDCSQRLARILESAREYDAAVLRRLGGADWRALAAMCNAGHLGLADE